MSTCARGGREARLSLHCLYLWFGWRIDEILAQRTFMQISFSHFPARNGMNRMNYRHKMESMQDRASIRYLKRFYWLYLWRTFLCELTAVHRRLQTFVRINLCIRENFLTIYHIQINFATVWRSTWFGRCLHGIWLPIRRNWKQTVIIELISTKSATCMTMIRLLNYLSQQKTWRVNHQPNYYQLLHAIQQM